MCGKPMDDIEKEASIINQTHWRNGTISDLAFVNPKTDISGLQDDSLVTFLPMEYIGENGRILKQEARRLKDVRNGYTCFIDGDVLFAKITPCMENGKGAVALNLINGIGYGSTEFHVIRPKELGDSGFIFHLTKSNKFRILAKKYMTGSAGQQRVSRDIFYHYRVPIPSFPERCKIAAILSTVDAVIEQTDAIIAQMERMKKGLMQELLTKGIKHTVFKKTSIGRIPEKWDVIYLGNNNYFDLVTGGTPSTKNKRYWENGDILWLLSGEIHKKRIYDTQKKISKLGYENSNATLLPKQSVLIALAGQGKTRGTTAITEIELTTNQSVAAIISNFNYLNPYYVYYVLDSMYEELRSKSSGSGRAGLSLTILREIGLSLPSLSEQNQIASTLLSVDDKLIIEKNRRIQLERLKKSLMQDLLTGRVRVKVDGNV